MKPRISVLTIGVSDLERSLVFYRDGLGLPTGERPPARLPSPLDTMLRAARKSTRSCSRPSAPERAS